MTEITYLDRRSFLKLFTLGAAGAVLNKYWPYIQRLGEISDRLGVFSHIEPRMRPGFHGLREEDARQNTALVGGEFRTRDLYRYFDQPVPPPRVPLDLKPLPGILEPIFHSHTRASNADLDEHKEALASLYKKGSDLVICDSAHLESIGMTKLGESLQKGNERALTLILCSIMAPVARLGMLLHQIRKNESLSPEQHKELWEQYKAKQEEKNEIKRIDTEEMLNVSLRGLIAGTAYTIFDWKGTAASFADITESVQKGLLSIDHEDLAKITDTVDIRSLSMAHNMNLGQRLLDRFPNRKNGLLHKFGEAPEVLMIFGSGHVSAEQYYKVGLAASTKELGKRAKEVLDWSEKHFKKAGDSEEKKQEALLTFITLTSAFSYPQASCMTSDEYLSIPELKEYPSPRAILWAHLIDRYYKNPEDSTLRTLVNTLAEEDVIYGDLLKGVVPNLQTRVFEAQQEHQTFDLPEGRRLHITEGIPLVEDKS